MPKYFWGHKAPGGTDTSSSMSTTLPPSTHPIYYGEAHVSSAYSSHHASHATPTPTSIAKEGHKFQWPKYYWYHSRPAASSALYTALSAPTYANFHHEVHALGTSTHHTTATPMPMLNHKTTWPTYYHPPTTNMSPGPFHVPSPKPMSPKMWNMYHPKKTPKFPTFSHYSNTLHVGNGNGTGMHQVIEDFYRPATFSDVIFSLAVLLGIALVIFVIFGCMVRGMRRWALKRKAMKCARERELGEGVEYMKLA
ncbi:hypothetical protein G7Y89_g3536 [Cudoniella acicularis]|uniref:Uncharacterized protein n=1 Tax=Cudoniella acicularis TaxID=354080 RepID=A0A8H4RR57_9HELO|nr:hypothetical protein G7Y89_g3536 [Cudoniella acicularis]